MFAALTKYKRTAGKEKPTDFAMAAKVNDPSELGQLKKKIDLCEYAAFHGYVVDKKKTTRKSSVMKRGDDQIVISIGEKGFYIYFRRGPKSSVDSGTIIDFVQAEYGYRSIGRVRVHLRDWLGWDDRPKIPPGSFKRISQRSSKDEIDLLKSFLELWDIDDERSNVQSYLNYRGIKEELVLSERFKSQLRTDKYNNVIFPHYVGKSVVGWETKNFRFTGFPKNSTKSVWFSNRFDTDQTLIMTEAGIEALSFYTLFPEFLDNAWCLATAGGWGPESEKMMELALKSFPNHNLILGFNNDKDGAIYDQAIIDILARIGDTREPTIMKPKDNDWNLDLKSKLGR